MKGPDAPTEMFAKTTVITKHKNHICKSFSTVGKNNTSSQSSQNQPNDTTQQRAPSNTFRLPRIISPSTCCCSSYAVAPVGPVAEKTRGLPPSVLPSASLETREAARPLLAACFQSSATAATEGRFSDEEPFATADFGGEAAAAASTAGGDAGGGEGSTVVVEAAAVVLVVLVAVVLVLVALCCPTAVPGSFVSHDRAHVHRRHDGKGGG